MKKNENEKILVTGCSGFIGMHLCKSLLDNDIVVYGIDNMNDYYDTTLKEKRLEILKKYKKFSYTKIDIVDYKNLDNIFKGFKPDKVVNLAAQAGVRHSLTNPNIYINSNINGFMNILECCRHNNIKGLIYASSSSVYGGNKKIPFSENDVVDNPISIYAASKKANELMAHTYSSLFNIHTTGLRFFTVYGPWGRPDMAMYIFTENILNNKPISVFNHGKMKRDFTYIDDIINGINFAINKNYKCEIFNLGNNRHEDLMEIITILEQNLGKKADINFKRIQLGDVEKTYADIEKAKVMLGYKPKINVDKGIKNFIKWYMAFHENI